MFIRTTARMLALSSAALGLAVALLAACKGPSDAGTDTAQDSSGGSDLEDAREQGRAECDRYLDCVVEATPEVVAALLASYGPEGECWKGDDIKTIELCTTACINALEGYTELYKDIPACGECMEDSHCAAVAGRTRCDPDSNHCVACVAAEDCGGGVCDPATRTCVECAADEDCASGNCIEKTHTCVECLEDSHCAPAYCDVDAQVCVECKFKIHCPDGVCDYATNTCVGCVQDSDCDAGQTCKAKTCG